MQTVTPEKNFGFYTYDEFCDIQSKIESNESLVIPETTLDKTEWWGYNPRAIHLLCILKALNKEKPFDNAEYKKLLQRLEEQSCNNALLTALIFSSVWSLWLALMSSLLLVLLLRLSHASYASYIILPIWLGVFALTFVIGSALSFKHQTNLKSEAELCTLRFFNEKGIKLENQESWSDEAPLNTGPLPKKPEAGVELTVMRSPPKFNN